MRVRLKFCRWRAGVGERGRMPAGFSSQRGAAEAGVVDRGLRFERLSSPRCYAFASTITAVPEQETINIVPRIAS